MKKTALIIDFNPKLNYKMFNYNNVDLFILDRLNNEIIDIIYNDTNDFLNNIQLEIAFNDFYKMIAKNYENVFCLFLSYSYENINDYLLVKQLNNNRTIDEAKVYMYLLNYINQNKKSIVENTLEMLNNQYQIKDIIVRIHNFRNKEAFSLNELILKYVSPYILQ